MRGCWRGWKPRPPSDSGLRRKASIGAASHRPRRGRTPNGGRMKRVEKPFPNARQVGATLALHHSLWSQSTPTPYHGISQLRVRRSAIGECLRANRRLNFSSRVRAARSGGAGGGGEIRTHGGVAPSSVFKTDPFNRSGTPPAAPSFYRRGHRCNGLDQGLGEVARAAGGINDVSPESATA